MHPIVVYALVEARMEQDAKSSAASSPDPRCRGYSEHPPAADHRESDGVRRFPVTRESRRASSRDRSQRGRAGYIALPPAATGSPARPGGRRAPR
jgi:hypothetical protein